MKNVVDIFGNIFPECTITASLMNFPIKKEGRMRKGMIFDKPSTVNNGVEGNGIKV